MVYIDEHIKKYPKMELVDIVKLCLQGIMGPAHLVSSYDKSIEFMMSELEEIKVDKHDIVEEISDQYVRVYLFPYYQKYGSFDKLTKAFILSSKIENDEKQFIGVIKSLMNDDNKEILQKYLDSKNYLVSHSENYKKLYDPHYRVINKRYLDLALGEEK